MTKLQVGIYVVSIFSTLLVVFIFMGIIPGLRDAGFNTTVTVWGTYSENIFRAAFAAWREENPNIFIEYKQQNTDTYTEQITEAIATGRAPDLLMITDTVLEKTLNKLAPAPTLHMTDREFNESFAGIAGIYRQNGALYGLPFAIDPMVLYWNRDFFASEAIALPPATWDEFLVTAQKLTKRSANGNITRAGAAMGLTSNIPQAIDIVSLLILQGGTDIINPQTHFVSLGEKVSSNRITVSPTETALRFYTDFARREKTSYVWNHTFPNPKESFVREDLAMFVAPASTLASLVTQAPHIDIGVSPVPQYSNTPVKIGYGRTWAFVVPLASAKQTYSWRVAAFLTGKDAGASLANAMWLAPARRDLLGLGNSFPPFSVFYEEALRARTWYDPDPTRSAPIVKNMIESVSAGRDITAAAAEANARLSNLFK